jgi:hypothetical protein
MMLASLLCLLHPIEDTLPCSVIVISLASLEPGAKPIRKADSRIILSGLPSVHHVAPHGLHSSPESARECALAFLRRSVNAAVKAALEKRSLRVPRCLPRAIAVHCGPPKP